MFMEADSETLPEKKRRFSIIDIRRELFNQATGSGKRAGR
jgi:hypothetical protein